MEPTKWVSACNEIARAAYTEMVLESMNETDLSSPLAIS